MVMFIVLLGVFAIIFTTTCSAFGITLPTENSVPEENNEDDFILGNKTKYEREIDDEILGVANHGRGLYKSRS